LLKSANNASIKIDHRLKSLNDTAKDIDDRCDKEKARICRIIDGIFDSAKSDVGVCRHDLESRSRQLSAIEREIVMTLDR
jgi:hypothetical protein